MWSASGERLCLIKSYNLWMCNKPLKKTTAEQSKVLLLSPINVFFKSTVKLAGCFCFWQAASPSPPTFHQVSALHITREGGLLETSNELLFLCSLSLSILSLCPPSIHYWMPHHITLDTVGWCLELLFGNERKRRILTPQFRFTCVCMAEKPVQSL